MAQFVDFVGLNTFIYEPVGWNPEEQVYGDGFLPLSGYEGVPFKFPPKLNFVPLTVILVGVWETRVAEPPLNDKLK